MTDFYFADNIISNNSLSVKILVHDLSLPFTPVWDKFLLYGNSVAFEIVSPVVQAEEVAAALKWYAHAVLLDIAVVYLPNAVCVL
ncbi:hypothetical protein [Mucilaginibacter sp. HD30]